MKIPGGEYSVRRKFRAARFPGAKLLPVIFLSAKLCRIVQHKCVCGEVSLISGLILQEILCWTLQFAIGFWNTYSITKSVCLPSNELVSSFLKIWKHVDYKREAIIYFQGKCQKFTPKIMNFQNERLIYLPR